MGLPLRWTLSLLLLLQAWRVTNGEEKEFPKMEDIFFEFFEAEVQVTDTNENSTAFAKEYYYDAEDMGRFDLLLNGRKTSLFYFRETGDILEITKKTCVSKTIESSMYSRQAIFYGWLRNNKPFVIGPSALLWFVNDAEDKAGKTVTYSGVSTIRGIKCDWYTVKVNRTNTNMTYNYYFADSDLISPNGKNGKRIPIRITLDGITSEYLAGSMIPVNLIVEFAYFRPIIEDSTKLLPPIGLGCPGKESSKYLPKIPEEFVFFEEELDLVYRKKHEDIFVNYNGIFFDQRRQYARFDRYTRTGLTQSFHDFNTGVTYYIEDQDTCEIRPLEHSYFENDGEVFQGNMKTAKQVMGMTGDFYYLGSRMYRGINVDVFEKAVTAVNEYDPYLEVVTAFFTSGMTTDVKNAETMVSVPVFFLDTVYDKPNNVARQMQFNVFGFEDVVGPVIYEQFPIASCFPLSQQKSYFVLELKEGVVLAEQIQNNNQQFTNAIKAEIMNVTNVSDLRIPFIKIDYQGAQTYATGLLLDRPPAIRQFHQFFPGPIRTSLKMTMVADAKSPEECAHACVDVATCGHFHFCGQKAPSMGVCLVDVEALDKPVEDGLLFDNCYLYVRAEMNSNNREDYLGNVLEKLKTAVDSDKEFKVTVFLNETVSVTLIVSNVYFGDGPFDKTTGGGDYTPVYNGFQLVPATESEVVLEKEYIDTELECYRSCRLEGSMSCETFSYCSVGDKKQCRLSPNFYTSDMEKPQEIKANKDCNVFSLNYVEFYDKNPGKVLLGQGELAFEKVNFPEECAMKCKKEVDLPCRGFDFCKTQKTCILHKTHVSDIHPSKIADSKGTTCVHYSAKFTADYQNLGSTIIDDDNDRREDLTAEECARACSEDNPSCKSFVYCRGFGTEDSTCSLTKKTLVSSDVKLKDDPKCALYSKKPGIKDWKYAALKPEPTGYTKSGFTGLVIGMLVFGLIVGAVGFMGYSYYRSRRPSDGMTVRFMKQTNA